MTQSGHAERSILPNASFIVYLLDAGRAMNRRDILKIVGFAGLDSPTDPVRTCG